MALNAIKARPDLQGQTIIPDSWHRFKWCLNILIPAALKAVPDLTHFAKTDHFESVNAGAAVKSSNPDDIALYPQIRIGLLLKRYCSFASAMVDDAFKDHALTFTQWAVLKSLCEQASPSSPTALRQQTGFDMGSLTRIIDVLEDEGLVRRKRSEQDRRAVEITLTSEGRRQVGTYDNLIINLSNRLVEPFSRNEVDILTALLQRLVKCLTRNSNAARRSPAARHENRLKAKGSHRRKQATHHP